MAIIQQNLLADETAITKVTTTGTVSNASGIETCVTTTPNTTWDTCGFYGTSTASITDGSRLYMKVRKRVNNSTAVVVGVSNGAALKISGSGMAAIYMNGANLTFYAWDTVFGSSVAMTINTWYYLLLVFVDSDTMQAYYNTTAHSNTLGDYTQLGTDSSVGFGTASVRFQHNSLGTLATDESDTDEYYFTDSSGLPLDILLEETFANETGITEVVPSRATVTNSANTEIITLSQATLVSEGFYGNSTVTLDEEDNLFCSFKFNETGVYVSVGAGRGINLVADLHYMTAHFPAINPLVSVLWNTQFGSGFTASLDTRYYFLIIFGSERQAIYYNATGYSATLADWTLLSTIPEGVADVGSAVRFLAYITGGSATTSVTVYPYAFRDNSQLVIANAPNPSGLSSATLAWHTVRLSYTHGSTSSNTTGTKVEKSTTGGGVGFTLHATAAQGSSTYDVTGLTAATTYYFRIRNDFSFGAVHHYSSYTSETSVTTPALAGGMWGGSMSECLLIIDE